MNPIEEKPQKADLRGKILKLKGITSEDSFTYIKLHQVLALIDEDSKAREEGKKRLATEAAGWAQDLEAAVIPYNDGPNRVFLMNLVKWLAELTASKQDSEGTG